MHDGWGIDPPFHLPVTVESGVGVGRTEPPTDTEVPVMEDVTQTSALGATQDLQVDLVQRKAQPNTQQAETAWKLD